jgi:hypothetical protein
MFYISFLSGCTSTNTSALDQSLFSTSQQNGILAREGFVRCKNYLYGWLANADSASGLIPRNIEASVDFWNAKDAAADNYPFMVLSAFFVDDSLFSGRMIRMLETEKQLTSRVRNMPDSYSFSKKGFLDDEIKMDEIIFGTSEYIKDGLLPLSEWLGKSPWTERMLGMLYDLSDEIDIAEGVKADGFGNATREEINGELLQVLSRMYWMTGDDQLLDWAVQIGDFYLLGNHHPTRDLPYLRLRDHGCELISGLCELYASTHFARPDKAEVYRRPLYEMLDRILAVGRNEDGLFYDGINPVTGEIVNARIADTWGYTLNGFYTVYQIDSIQSYKDAVLKVFSNLEKYKNYDWENGSADGYADAIEGALNLYNRLPDPGVAAWIDGEIKVMWAMQKESGVIEGWHGDGNFARTTLMYNLWKSKGLYVKPWRDDLVLGAVEKGDTLILSITSDLPWTGKLFFDNKRFTENMGLPMDWPRINQFPEWFTVDLRGEYTMMDVRENERQNLSGTDLVKGVELATDGQKKMIVTSR